MTPDGAASTVATWYRPGHPERPPYLGGNPVRTWVTTYECADGRAGTITSEAWREADPEWPAIPQAPCMAGVLRLTVDQVTEGLPPVRVVDWEAPQPLIDTVTDYPQCVDGSCQLLLERIDPVTGKPLSCFANPALCAGWWPETQADPDAAAEKYRCTYAGQPVPLEECRVYGPVFDTGDYGDPETGDPPGPGGDPGPDPEGPPRDDACPPPFTWTSLINPWWWYKGTACALQEAFVPKGTLPNIKTTGTLVDDIKGIGAIVGRFDIPDGSCGVIVDHPVQAFQGGRIVVDTCEEPWSSAGPLRGLIGAAFWVVTVITAIQILTRAFGIRSFVVASFRDETGL